MRCGCCVERTPIGPLKTVQKSLLRSGPRALTPAQMLSFLGAASRVAVFFIAYGSLLMFGECPGLGAFLVLSIAPTTDRTVPCSISFLPLAAFYSPIRCTRTGVCRRCMVVQDPQKSESFQRHFRLHGQPPESGHACRRQFQLRDRCARLFG